MKTASLLDGLTVTTVEGKTATRYVLWAGENPKFAGHLRTWGEAGSIKTRVRGTPKIADRGTQCMMVGYSIDHAGDCYQMWDPVTGGIHDTRDVTYGCIECTLRGKQASGLLSHLWSSKA